jgi:hypothetical protein
MVNQTLIKLLKDGREVGSFWAVGPIVRPYAGEPVENEVIFELSTVPEDCRYLGVGSCRVSVKTPEGAFDYSLKLVPEEFCDDWEKEFPDAPEVSDALIRTLGGLIGVLNDEELRSAVNTFCYHLIPESLTFKRELERLSQIALKEPLWFVEVFKYKPGEGLFVEGSTWVEISSPEFTTEEFVATADRKIELRPLGPFTGYLFDKLKRHLKRGFVADLVLTPEVFRLRFYLFGEKYLELHKDFEERKIHKWLATRSRPAVALLRELARTLPPFVEVQTFEDELLLKNLSELKEALMSI